MLVSFQCVNVCVLPRVHDTCTVHPWQNGTKQFSVCMYVYTCVCIYIQPLLSDCCWSSSMFVCLCLCECICAQLCGMDCATEISPYCHSHNNWGLQNCFQRFLVPVYNWKIVEKPVTDSQLLWEYHLITLNLRSRVCCQNLTKIVSTANLIIIDVCYQLSTVFSTILLLENRWNHYNGRQFL